MLQSIKILSISFTLLLLGIRVSATVGGPTTIERLSYSEKENSIYYLVNDGGGRGCPPIIEKINITTKERSQVKSCDEVESTYYKEEGSDATYNQLIEDTFSYPNLKFLSLIHLDDNKISIKVEHLRENRLDELDEFNISSDFRATIFQNNQKKETIDFTGCYKDQPNVFKGYAVPNSNKLIMEISRIGDCFEGGYTKDDIYILDNINLQNSDPMGYNYFSEPGVHRGNLVVSAQDSNITVSIPETAEKNYFTSIRWVPALIIGLIVGFMAGRKRKTKSTQEFSAKQ